jgi:hypothetical protein
MGKDVQYINPSAVRMPGWGFYASRSMAGEPSASPVNLGARFERYPFARREHRGGERYDPNTDLVLIGGLGNTPTDTGGQSASPANRPGEWASRCAPRKRQVIRGGYGLSIDPDTNRYMRDSYPATVATQYNAPEHPGGGGQLPHGPSRPRVVPDLNTGSIAIPKAVRTVTWPVDYRRGYFQSF